MVRAASIKGFRGRHHPQVANSRRRSKGIQNARFGGFELSFLIPNLAWEPPIPNVGRP